MGLEGAKAWLEVLEDNKYHSSDVQYRATNEIINVVKAIEVRTMVSLGPGDGRLDSEISIALKNSEPWLNYIPVDINQYLLEKSASFIGQQVIVPIAIHSDFEDRLSFIEHHVLRNGKRPFLFTILGSTIGNIENYERQFFDILKSMMKKGDYLLVDVSTKGKKWKFDDDRRARLDSFGEGQRRFLCNGLKAKTKESIDAILSDFEDRIKFREGLSDIPDATTIEIFDSKSNNLITKIRRFNYESIIDWFKTEIGFNVTESVLVGDSADVLGKGIILLERD